MLVTWTWLIKLVAELSCQLLSPSPVYTNFQFLHLLDHLFGFLGRNRCLGVSVGKQILTPVCAMYVVAFLTKKWNSKKCVRDHVACICFCFCRAMQGSIETVSPNPLGGVTRLREVGSAIATQKDSGIASLGRVLCNDSYPVLSAMSCDALPYIGNSVEHLSRITTMPSLSVAHHSLVVGQTDTFMSPLDVEVNCDPPLPIDASSFSDGLSLIGLLHRAPAALGMLQECLGRCPLYLVCHSIFSMSCICCYTSGSSGIADLVRAPYHLSSPLIYVLRVVASFQLIRQFLGTDMLNLLPLSKNAVNVFVCQFGALNSELNKLSITQSVGPWCGQCASFSCIHSPISGPLLAFLLTILVTRSLLRPLDMMIPLHRFTLYAH